jgi:hypothetical protein
LRLGIVPGGLLVRGRMRPLIPAGPLTLARHRLTGRTFLAG